MKKLFLIAFGLFLINLLGVHKVKAQANEKVRKMVVGVWKIEAIQKAKTDTINPFKDFKEIFENPTIQERRELGPNKKLDDSKVVSSIILEVDGKFEAKLESATYKDITTGEWELDIEGKNMTVLDNKGKRMEFEIIVLTKDKMILKINDKTLILSSVQIIGFKENKKVRRMAVGKWKIGDLKISYKDTDNMSEDEKKKIGEMIEEMKTNSYFNFMENGEYEMKMTFMGQDLSEWGKWKIDKKGKNFLIISEEGKETSQIIEEISKNKLILQQGSTIMTLVK